MSISSATIATLHNAIADVIEAALAQTSIGPIIVYADRRPSADLPFATVNLTSTRRNAPDLGSARRESELGKVDLFTSWRVSVSIQHDEPGAAASAEDEIVARLIACFDDDETLGGTVRSCAAALVETDLVDRAANADDHRKLLRIDATVDTYSLH